MKKLLTFILMVGLFYVVEAYAANTCTWGGNTSTCTTFDPTTFNQLQSSCDTAKQALEDGKKTLCGAGNYNLTTKKCISKEPADADTGGLWGAWRKLCFSNKIAGSCMWYVPSSDNYRFIHGVQGKPGYKAYTGESCRYSLFDTMGPVYESNAQTEPPELSFCDAGIVCLRDSRDSGIYFPDFYEARWICRKYQGWDKEVKGDKVRRHSNNRTLNTGESMEAPADEDEMEGVVYDGTLADTCKTMCTKYWSIIGSIDSLESSLTSAQTALNSMCNAPCTTPECVCTTQEECKCEQEDKGYWFADAAKPTCICKGLLGDKFNECVCTKGPKKGVWINGDCDRKGSGGLPTYDDDGAGGGLGSTAGNDSTDSGTELSVSSGGSGLSGLGDVGGASKAAGSSAGYGSGKSWIAQLKDTFGVSSTAGGQKPGASSKGGSFGVGTGGAPTKSKGATHGIADSKSDLFAMVTTTYNTQYTSGKIMDQPSGATSTKPVKKLGSQPISY